MLKRLITFLFVFLPLQGLAMSFTLSSTAFHEGNSIPSAFTCDGANHSPPLHWIDPPAGTQSFVLIMDDPDAPVGTWDHWILFNIPATTNSLAENIHALPNGTQTGRNSWGKNTYGGPCPPDREHRYFFKLYALDTTLRLTNGATKSAIEAAMKGHVLASATLMGKYERRK